MGTKKEDVDYVAQLIHSIAETHFTHPDPVARLFSAGMSVDHALIELMKILPREESTICAGG